MGAIVPLEDLPPPIRQSILPGTASFNAYAKLLEQQYSLPPGTLLNAEFKLEPQADYGAVLLSAARDAAKNPPIDPSVGELPLRVGPWDTGLKMPQGVSRVAAGFGKSLSDTYHGGRQMLGLEDSSDADERQKLDKPLMGTTGGFWGNVAGTVAQSALPASAAWKGAKVLSAVAPRVAAVVKNPLIQGSAVGAGVAGAQPVLTGDSRGVNAAMGAAEGAVGTGVTLGFAAAARPAKEAASKAVGVLADKAAQHGIPLRAAQVSPSKLLEWATKGLDKLPFGTGKKLEAAQQSAFNRALSRTMGQDTDDAAAALVNARKEIGDFYDDIKSRFDLQLEPWHVDFMKEAWDDFVKKDISKVGSKGEKAHSAQLRELARSIVESTDPSGVMSGGTYKQLRSRLGHLSTSGEGAADPAYKHVLKQYQFALDQAFKSGLPAKEAAALSLADKQWANMRTLEKLAPTDANGDFDFHKLAPLLASKNNANAANRAAMIYGQGDQTLPDLARIGQQFLERGPGPTGPAWMRAAKQARDAAIAPTAVAGGLYALNHDEEHPWLNAAGQAAGLALASRGLSAANNSRWFERGVPWLRNLGENLTEGGLGQVYTGMKNAWKGGIDIPEVEEGQTP